ncbi:MAG: stage III sporulation protein AB [Clostridia bacterium]|nr:stage III sporulation protein AB [Clostridia bacterium]
MAIRYTALFVLFASGSLAAYIFKGKFSRAVAAEEEIIRLIDHIRNKIMYFSEPIEDIYSSFECDVLSETGFTETAFEHGWESAVDLLKNNSVITEGFADSIREFGEKLGSLFTEEEINNCNYYISRGTEQLEKDKLELPKKSKLYSTFSIAGSLLIAVMLF